MPQEEKTTGATNCEQVNNVDNGDRQSRLTA